MKKGIVSLLIIILLTNFIFVNNAYAGEPANNKLTPQETEDIVRRAKSYN